MKISAGILMYRKRNGRLEVLLVHPGGPFFKHKDNGVWSIPKGEIDLGEDFLQAALREFHEEIGIALDVKKDFLELGEIKQKGGKVVYAWGHEGDFPPGHQIPLGHFHTRQERTSKFPEVDQAKFFPMDLAWFKILESQRLFLERLIDKAYASQGTDL